MSLTQALGERYTPKSSKLNETERMRSRAEEARTIALVYYQLVGIVEDQERELRENYRQEKITGKMRDQRQLELTVRKRALKEELDEKLAELKSTYDAEVDTWSELSGAKLTDDIKLLDNHFLLNDSELTSLSAKHRDNVTMQRAIRGYATRNNLCFTAATPLPEMKKQYFWTLLDDILKSSVDEGRLARGFIQDDRQFNSLYGKALNTHGELVEPPEDETDYGAISLQQIIDPENGYSMDQIMAWRTFHDKAGESADAEPATAEEGS